MFEYFEGSEAIHGTHGEPDLDDNGVKWSIKRTARTLKGGATQALWDAHLKGTTPLGVVAIKNNSTCHWGSADIDEYDVDAVAVVKRVEDMNLPLVPCRSKSGGLHLFLFTSEPVSAELMQGVLRSIAATLGFAGCEIFPKQTKVMVEHGDQGNWMVMPYFGGDFGGKLRMQYGLKKTGAEMTIDEFVNAVERKRLNAVQMEELRVRVLRGDDGKPKKKRKEAGEREAFHNGPWCLQTMARSGFPDGGRNNALFHIGVFHRRANPDDWQQRVEKDNQEFMKPPLPLEEVRSVIKSLEKKGYEYTCKNQPMESHCDPVVCRSRKFGVGGGGAYPVIEGIQKLKTDPPLWFIQIPGSRVMLENEFLYQYRKFQIACTAAEPSVAFKYITDKEWSSVVCEAINNMNKETDLIEAPDNIGRTGVFKELLYNFLTNRTIGEKREDVLRNVPWEDEENKRFVFSIKALEDYVKREQIQPRFTRPELLSRLRDTGASDIMLDVKNQRNVRLWQLPIGIVTRAPELDPPNEEREII
jgi:hypothetical protein